MQTEKGEKEEDVTTTIKCLQRHMFANKVAKCSQTMMIIIARTSLISFEKFYLFVPRGHANWSTTS